MRHFAARSALLRDRGMELEPGARVGGLEIERELGRGAYGVVYLARDVLIGRHVALKVLPADGGPVPDEVREQVLSEARLVGRLQSPHVVTLYRVHAGDDGAWMLEMEFVGGGSLESRLGDARRLPVPDAVRVVAGVTRALEAAHAARIVHGDIKPANVLYAADGTPKLADFGIARMLGAGGVAQCADGQVAGTPYYMAPEILDGRGARVESDLWSVGVLACEILTGRLPFQGESLPALFRAILMDPPPPLPPDVPEALAAVILRCLAKDPAERPPSAAALLDELDRLGRDDRRITAVVARSANPTNLAPANSSFVGRAEDVRRLTGLLRDASVRVLTLSGPGGIGKTRLAREVAAQALDRFPGGAWFVDLSATSDAEGVAQAVAAALGVRDGSNRPPVQLVAEVLAYRPELLLVLDNFEQVAAHAAATIGAWSGEAPLVRFLVTSRAVLGLAGETQYELSPLGVPDDPAAESDPDLAAAHDAVRLFVERAKEARPDFRIDAVSAPHVVRICRELEGLPLAIELAAARIRILSPAQILEHLSRKFQLLTSTRRDTSARQSTLRGAIEWSIGLLEPWEREAFLQACRFVDGFSMEAVERVVDLWSHPEAPWVVDIVQSLRDQSLLTVRDAGHETRLGMYRAIHDYGAETWARTAPEEARRALAERHAAYFVEFAESWNTRGGGPREAEVLERIALEIGNLRLAHAHALERRDGALAARAALALAESLIVHRPPTESVEVMRRTLDVLPAGASEERARLMTHLCIASERTGDWQRALEAAGQAVAAARDIGRQDLVAQALTQLGVVRRDRGDLAGAEEAWGEAERLATAVGDRSSLAAAVGGLGMVHHAKGRMTAAVACYETAERISRELGDLQTAALHVGNRGVVFEQRGDKDAAIACHAEAENLARRIGDRLRVAIALGNQANARSQKGDLEGAIGLYRQAEAIARELGVRQRIAQIVGNRGAVHAIRGELEAALACCRESEAVARALGDWHRTAIALQQRAGVHRRRNEHQEAAACHREAIAIAMEVGDRILEARNRCALGATLSALDCLDESWTELSKGIEVCDAVGATGSVWYFTFAAILASLADIRGDRAAALRLAVDGLNLAGRLGLTEEHADADVREALATFRRIATS